MCKSFARLNQLAPMHIHTCMQHVQLLSNAGASSLKVQTHGNILYPHNMERNMKKMRNEPSDFSVASNWIDSLGNPAHIMIVVHEQRRIEDFWSG